MTITGLQLENHPQALHLVYIRNPSDVCQVMEKNGKESHSGGKVLGNSEIISAFTLMQIGFKSLIYRSCPGL